MNRCRLRLERNGDDFVVMIPPEIVEAWGLKEGSMVEVIPIPPNDSPESEVRFLEGLIQLWREEEQRLHALVADSNTSPEVVSQSRRRSDWIHEAIGDHEKELAELQTGR